MKLKKILKSKIFIFLLGGILLSTVSVYAVTYFPSIDVTYDNKESGLKSTNVQGAIDELYVKAKEISNGSEGKVEDMGGTVTSGDGLYADLYEEGRYIYKGKNPNNYITFNDENAGWRIISIEPDGTMKIMKIANIGNHTYSSSFNDWKNADLNTYLNGTYYNGLNSTAKSQIVSHNFSVGAGYVDSNDGNTSDLTDQVNAENEQLWNGKVGLVTATEYLRSNSNTNNCRTIALFDQNNGVCQNTTWMFNKSDWWTMSASTYQTTRAFYVQSTGKITDNYVSFGFAIRPAVYISSSIKLSGSGTSSDPYIIN